MFERQSIQIPFTIIAACLVLYIGMHSHSSEPSFLWLCLGVLSAVLHHTYVWFFWRIELIYKWVTKNYGEKGFIAYSVMFFILMLSRLLTATVLAVYDKNSLHIDSTLYWTLVISISTLSGYSLYSVARYFGFKRATGADHFFEKYRDMPLVNKGMFKYTSNSMYGFGTLVIILPGVIAQSKLAITLGIFNYMYAWVHYFCLEKPDMQKIYQNK